MPISSVSTFLGAGVILGLSAGFAPGPLLTLVVSQTLRHGAREGVKVALAPLLTDLPIILACFFILKRFAHSEMLLGLTALVGGAFVLHLAIDSFRARPLSGEIPEQAPRSFGRGVLVNFLSPHPYLFWMTVGAPLMVKAWNLTPLASLAFATGFYTCLVGAKVLLALLSGRCRAYTSGRVHEVLLRFLGVLLLIFAGLLIKEGIQLLGWAAE
ncbi:MAG: LysE family translocator [Syntrophobacteraceae bacterium]|jgi:threonine/homoserine/homoserine lactone efflux protein|nr:LysE family translocator [Syntrophobacteraceae bacterium]